MAAAGGGPANVYVLPSVEDLPAMSTYRLFKKRGYDPELLTRAQEIYHRSGPICTTEGFYQHSGECWNDSIQTLICYGTGVNRFVQEALLFKTTEEIVAHMPEETRPLYAIYVDAMRMRFVRSVLNEEERADICSTARLDAEKVIRLKYGRHRAGGINSFVSTLFGMEFSGKEISHKPLGRTVFDINYSTAGRKGAQITPVLTNILQLFKLNAVFNNKLIYTVDSKDDVKRTITKKAFAEILNPDTIGVVLTIENVSPGIFVRTGWHAVVFYTCNGVEYYYDDNQGIVKFPWRKLLGEGMQPDLSDKDVNLLTVRVIINGINMGLPGLLYDNTFVTYNPFNGSRILVDTRRFTEPRLQISPHILVEKVLPTTDIVFNILQKKPGVDLPENVKRRPIILGRGKGIYFPSNSSSEGAAAGGNGRPHIKDVYKLRKNIEDAKSFISVYITNYISYLKRKVKGIKSVYNAYKNYGKIYKVVLINEAIEKLPDDVVLELLSHDDVPANHPTVYEYAGVESPLTVAIKKVSPAIVERLLEKGATHPTDPDMLEAMEYLLTPHTADSPSYTEPALGGEAMGGAAAGGAAPARKPSSETSIASRITVPKENMNSYIAYERKYEERQAAIKKAMATSDPEGKKYNSYRRMSQRVMRRRTQIRKNVSEALGITPANLERARKNRMTKKK